MRPACSKRRDASVFSIASILRWSLKALLCGRGDEWRRFDALFDAYFMPPNRKVFARELRRQNARPARLARGRWTAGLPACAPARSRWGDGEDDARGDRHGASRLESLASTDFRDLDRADQVRDIEALMRLFARRLRHLHLRREARFDRGRRLDLQRTIRRASPAAARRFGWPGRIAAACGRGSCCCSTSAGR